MWFAANLLFEGVHAGQPRSDNLWEERIILLHASTEDEARQQAISLGKAEEHSYVSATQEHVHWLFRQVESLSVIDAETLEGGTEIYSRFLRASDVQNLLAPILDTSPDHLHSQTV